MSLIIVLVQELMVENNDLRESLKSMQAELINLLNHQSEDYNNENDTEVSAACLIITEFVFISVWHCRMKMVLNLHLHVKITINVGHKILHGILKCVFLLLPEI